jgi:hypothetical protein
MGSRSLDQGVLMHSLPIVVLLLVLPLVSLPCDTMDVTHGGGPQCPRWAPQCARLRPCDSQTRVAQGVGSESSAAR